MADDELEILERDGWAALRDGGEAARDHYDGVLDDSAVMLLPGGLVLDERAVMIQTVGDSPWESFELEQVRVVHPTSDTGLVTYGAVGHRGGQEYSALFSSLYVRRDDGWRLVFHQQTPR